MRTAEMLKIMKSVPILPFRCLPTEDRPRIVLHGDQSRYRAEASIDNMALAPVLYDAIRMVNLLIFVLAVSSQAKKTKHAKCVEC